MELLLIVTSILALTASAYRRDKVFSFQPDNNFQYHPPWFTDRPPEYPEPERRPHRQPGPPCYGPHGQSGPPCFPTNQVLPEQNDDYGSPEASEVQGPSGPLFDPPWFKPTTTTKRSHVYPNYPNYDKSTTQRSTTAPADLSIIVDSCVATCPMLGDYAPVCGTNNVTYANIESLECAKQCGVAVDLSSSSSCQSSEPVQIPDVISACISTCSVTSEFNPVCGTDNVTYSNLGRFECAKNCGRDIELSRMSSCAVPPGPGNPDLRPTTTESPKTNENGDNNTADNNTADNNTADNNTADNNTADNNTADSKNNGGNNCNANGDNMKKPSVTEIIACMQLCPMTTEVNPVCGTDGVTYTNPGKLLCTQFCGVDVKVQKFSTCSGEELPAPRPSCPCALPLTPPTTEDCIRRCPVTQELKPVCGSDGVTYINLASLKCKMGCGVDVSVQKLSPCGEASTNPPTTPSWNNTDRTTQPTVTPTTLGNVQTCIDKCYVTPERKPVCGTNGQTYESLARLRCAQRCGISVDVKKLTACDVTEPDQSFTISPDILASIFPEDFKPTTPKDSEEEYDIDQRFGD